MVHQGLGIELRNKFKAKVKFDIYSIHLSQVHASIPIDRYLKVKHDVKTKEFFFIICDLIVL